MSGSFRPSALVPAGMIVEDARQEGGVTVITVKATAGEAACPVFGALASGGHSRYVRTPADLPPSGRVVRLQVLARRLAVCVASLPATYAATWIAVGFSFRLVARHFRRIPSPVEVECSLQGRPSNVRSISCRPQANEQHPSGKSRRTLPTKSRSGSLNDP